MRTGPMAQWFLEGVLAGGDALQRIPIDDFPVLIGRQDGLALAGTSAGMSRYHAELVLRDNRLVVRDLGSKNGTFVNLERIAGERPVEPGDVLHFADAEFRLGRTEPEEAEEGEVDRTSTAIISRDRLSRHFPTGSRSLETMLEQRAVTCLFQPIVSLQTGETVARECLARGTLPELPEAPDTLFRIAASIGREVELAELMRVTGVAAAAAAGLRQPLFINIHPREVRDLDRLLAHLGSVRVEYPGVSLVLELHESAITDLRGVASLARGLEELGVSLAYDDFGAGQARLMELVEVPPDYLKFDRSLVIDLDRCPDSQRHMVTILVHFARDHGIRTLAEGITGEQEAAACREVGFDLAQGFLFGHPQAEGSDETARGQLDDESNPGRSADRGDPRGSTR